MTSVITIDHSGLLRCKFCYAPAVRSRDVIKSHQKCHQKVTKSHKKMSIDLHRKELQHRAFLIVFNLSSRIEWYTFWPWGQIKVTRPEVASCFWPYEVSICVFRCISTRGSRWCYYFWSSLFSLKVICKKYPQVLLFWLFPLWCYCLPDLKITCVKLIDLVRPYPIPFIACL